MSSEHKERMAEAIRLAEESRGGNLLSLGSKYFPGMAGNGKVKVCPGCGEKDKFSVFRTKAGHWTWGCFKPSCKLSMDNIKAEKHGDAIGMIQHMEGCTRDEAIDKYLAIAGIPNPRNDLPPKDERKKQSPTKKTAKPETSESQPTPDERAAQEISPQHPAITETQDPSGFSLSAGVVETTIPNPEHAPTIWDEIHSLLMLDAGDRELLKKKRGFSRETIEAAGYRSSRSQNRDLLAPLMSKHPVGLLLSEGICSKDLETGAIKINSQLCGYGLKKRGDTTESDSWDWTNPVIIPYYNKHGRITNLRPHKGGLSGKRFMRENGFERGFRSTRTRTHPYFAFNFWQENDKWQRRCVFTEGEHKANALAQCGIRACATPGIQMLRNEVFFEELVNELRDAGIHEIIVAYDNEDKSHKPDPWDRYDVEVYALYACHALRGAGFRTSHCILPDEWRVDGKADWDGALLQFGSKAPEKFNAALKKAKPYFPQTELFGTNQRDRIVQCKLNRLLHVPQILTGDDEEQELAQLILKTPMPWRQEFSVRDLASLLFNTRGCYYVHNKPPKEVLLSTKTYTGLYEKKNEIKQLIQQTPVENLDEKAGLEAALAAVNLLIKGKPEILSDFTVSCDFQVRTQSGEIHRLFRFRNKHGQVSKLVTVPPTAIAGAMNFRTFAMGIGNFNPELGDRHLQKLNQDLGTFSAWREIRELEMLGRDPESNLWIFGDCAFAPDADLFTPRKPGQDPDVIFADKHDIIWYDGIGYRVNPEDLAGFAHREPPRFFQVLGKDPSEVYGEMKANPEAERIATAKVFFQFAADLICTFGDASGLLVMGCILGYTIAPELLAKYHGHPGLWIHGRQFSGKSETSRFLMQTWGFDPAYKTFVLSIGTTPAFIDRVFAQYCDIPVHADEFRQKEADENRIASLRSPFNRQSKGKAKMEQSNKTRTVNPMTSPIVTGEGVTNDSATLSRYIEAILASDKRLGTKEEQNLRYQRMLSDSTQYHRIIRYILLNRKWFAKLCMESINEFIAREDVVSSITSDRMRLSYGTAYCAFTSLMSHFSECVEPAKQSGTWGDSSMTRSDLLLLIDKVESLRSFTLNYARNAVADVTSVNFVIKFWKDVMTFTNINTSGIRRFIWFERCIISEENKVVVTNSKTDQPGIVRCVIIKPNELYAEYMKDSRQRGNEPDLPLSNIRGECQQEKFWVPAPKSQKRQAHRMSMEGHGQIDVWVLRCDRMDVSMESIFSEKFEEDPDDMTIGI